MRPELTLTEGGPGLEVANLHLHAPTLDDVFLAKTGRTLEGAGDAPEPVATA